MTSLAARTERFRAARDSPAAAPGGLRRRVRRPSEWPRFEHFNWALDWFDVIAQHNERPALWIVEEDGPEPGAPSRSCAAAPTGPPTGCAPREWGGDRIVVMLGNQVELWEAALAAMKLRAVIIPATPLLGPADLRDRIERGRARHVIVRAEDAGKFADVRASTPGSRSAARRTRAGWRTRRRTRAPTASSPTGPPGPTTR